MEERDGQETDEQQVAVGGVFDRRAGCLLIPFLPVRAAGALIVTTRRLIFDPVLHYKLVARRTSTDLSAVSGVEVSGSDVGLSMTELVTFGRTLTIRLKSGGAKSYRSMQADQLAAAIDRRLREQRTDSAD